ncbi:DEAD/DEAH box helicase family protein [Romboutsia sp. 1001713B170207_170306_H8]|uniref:DEAD/DEAH box helicase family protein n=1 Tax=Romboutsia sp. 1001713B170207_170306_H8 TaxID=2787112 RepID=UPI001898BC28|nr:DEAD/DEAH box helicase family protein [Romboutsia sp. 1001713B170207_170306_H8]
MYSCLLQKYIDTVADGNIDITNLMLDLKSFNSEEDINLYEYQIEALENTCKLLIQYFKIDKEEILDYYYSNLEDEARKKLNIELENKEADILRSYFDVIENKISFLQFTNRASYWMATGSGKTLIIVKLIEILYKLMKSNELPSKKILIVAPDIKLVEQIKSHIDIFNSDRQRDCNIYLKDLKSYENMEFSAINPLAPNSITIYYTLSHHISNQNKDLLLDYKSYIEKDGWYIILDEAHKGDAQESTRKQYLNILARNGFLFNFSATFTDPIDIITTIFDFKLDEFIKSGYGKNIKVLDEEFRNFKDKNKRDEEFKIVEKEDILIKSFIVYTAFKKASKYLNDYSNKYSLDLIYHNPLMITISKEIKTDDADMKLYFKCLADIAKGVDKNVLDNLKEEVVNKLKSNQIYSIGEEVVDDELIAIIQSVTYEDILLNVFNSKSPGEIEVSEIGKQSDELTFRLKTSDVSTPFALIKASKVAVSWKKNVLNGYNFTEDIVADEKGRFEDIRHNMNEINILMGSKQFVEGWDSNRPNVINFINMGVSDENTKLVLQAIGRGVRIEPYKNNRKRLKKSEYLSKIKASHREEILPLANIMESLFVFATNKEIIKNILKNLEKDDWRNIKGVKKTVIKKDILVPVYKDVETNNVPYKVSKSDYNTVESYIDNSSKALLLVRDSLNLKTINKIKNKDNIIVKDDIKSKDIEPLKIINTIEHHFAQKGKELVDFIKDEKISITHYKSIKGNLKDVSSEELLCLEKGIKHILNPSKKDYSQSQIEVIELVKSVGEDKVKNNETLINLLTQNGLSLDDILNSKIAETLNSEYNIKLKNIASHYYNPIVLSKNNYKYKHIIKNESEIEFLEVLEKYIQNNQVDCDWWYFSKIDESQDDIYIPYYDNQSQKYRKFYPDFVFWIKKDDMYHIKFVDPKGLTREENPMDKVRGFNEIFNQEIYSIGDLDIQVELLYYNGDDKEHQELNEHKFYKDSLYKLFEIKGLALA